MFLPVSLLTGWLANHTVCGWTKFASTSGHDLSCTGVRTLRTPDNSTIKPWSRADTTTHIKTIRAAFSCGFSTEAETFLPYQASKIGPSSRNVGH